MIQDENEDKLLNKIAHKEMKRPKTGNIRNRNTNSNLCHTYEMGVMRGSREDA